jgi:hypothetical protein
LLLAADPWRRRSDEFSLQFEGAVMQLGSHPHQPFDQAGCYLVDLYSPEDEEGELMMMGH